MSNRKAYLIFVSLTAVISTNSCSNKGSAPSGSSLSMPQVTTAVNGVSSQAFVQTKALTGLSLNSQSCSSCGNGALMSVWSLASTFILQGKIADANSCIIKAVAKSNVVPGLTSGEYKTFNDSSGPTKVKITANGTDVTSFEIFSCNGSTQSQYMSGTNTNGNVTFNLKISGGTVSQPIFVKMLATGTMEGANWTSKTLTVGYSVSSNYSEFTIAQQSNYLDITGYVDSGTLGTLDANDVQLVSRSQLIGSTVPTYALGDGSVRIATGGGSASSTNWNGDTGVVGSGPTTYDSAVASATFPSVPTTRTTSFTSSEQWDCSVGSDAINLEQAATSNATLMTDVQSCILEFQ
jgi:hypothetical protein